MTTKPRIPAKPKSKSTLEKIGGAVKGAVDGALQATRPKPNVINVNPVAPIIGAIKGGVEGYQGKTVTPPNKANSPKRVVGSGPAMADSLPKLTKPMPEPKVLGPKGGPTVGTPKSPAKPGTPKSPTKPVPLTKPEPRLPSRKVT